MAENVLRREPVISAGLIVSAVGAVVNVLNAFAITTIAPDQVQSINAAILAMWPLLLVIRQVVYSPASVDDIRDGGGQ
jgi:hypothetical protein